MLMRNVLQIHSLTFCDKYFNSQCSYIMLINMFLQTVSVQNGAELTIICEPTTASDSVTKLRLLIGTPGTPRARDVTLH